MNYLDRKLVSSELSSNSELLQQMALIVTNRSDKLTITSQASFFEDLYEIENFIKVLVESEGDLFSYKRCSDSNIKKNPLELSFEYFLEVFLAFPKIYKNHQFSLYATEFIKCITELNLDCHLALDYHNYISLMNRCVENIRITFRCEKFKEDLAYKNRGINKNLNSFYEYSNSILQNNKKVFLLSIDLSYFNNSCSETNHVSIDYNDVKQHRILFFKACRDVIFKENLLGYVWRLDYTPDQGFSLNIMLFLNGSESYGSWLGQELGFYWVKNITENKGVFFYSNQSNFCYRFGKNGICSNNQEGKLRILRRLIYITISDKYINFSPPNGDKKIGKGRLKKLLV